MAIPELSVKGIGPLGGIVGIFLIALEFQTARFVAAACPSIVDTALPDMASKFARRMHIVYTSSNPDTRSRPSMVRNQQSLHWNGI